MKKIYFVTNDYVNTRFDRWFKKNVSPVPQSLIEKNIRKGKIKINNLKIKSAYKLKRNDKIALYDISFANKLDKKFKKKYIPSKKDLAFSSKIFIENNENFVVINKPAGLPVQGGTKSFKNLMDILKSSKEFEDGYPYIVHRIDKETTGILIVAKNRKYAQLFTSLFRIRRIHKTYLCITLGTLVKNKGTLRDELLHYEGNKKIKALAVTHYNIIDSNNNYSLIKLNPQTGRKHQLRKQLLIHGCPVLGDSKYNISTVYKKDMLMLHAYKIHFSIDGVKYNFCADLPKNFKDTLKEKYLKIYQQ